MGKEIRKNTYSIMVIILFILSIGFAATTFHLIGVLSRPTQTYIGTIAISNYEESQYSNIISSNLFDWKEDSKYNISFQNFDMDIDFDYFEADIAATISQITENELNSVVYSISESNELLFAQELSAFYTDDIINLIDTDTLLEDILGDLRIMSMINNYDLTNYFVDGTETTILSSLTVNNLDPVDVTDLTDKITTLEVASEDRFYLLEESQGLALTNNQLSILASAIQAITMNSSLNSYIFEQNVELPAWGLEGMNVRILQTNNYDFSFYNSFDYSMSIHVSKNDDSSITFELIGYPFVCDYTTTNILVTDVDFNTTYEANDTIVETTPGVIITETDEEFTYQLLTQTGIAGKIIKFERTTTFADASSQKTILFYEEYEPINQVYQENIVSKDGE
jgi:hypothetical protein